MSTTGGQDIGAIFQAEIDRILGSPEFSSSRQLQEFLRFTAGRALAGADHLDQVEIAAEVLGRSDFDPIQDASVRKLASLTRQRLEQYYKRTGTPPSGCVTLPLRSYLPRVEFGAPAAEIAPAEPVRKRRWLGAAVLAGAVSLGGLIWAVARRSEPEAAGSWRLQTARGDLQYAGADVAPDAVRVGPALKAVDEIVARLNFSPTEEAQQAGIIVWQGPDDFVKLGRRFLGRNQIEFVAESRGASVGQHMAFDPEGQSGAPVWLAIRRDGGVYRGFVSGDGLHWESWGEPVSPGSSFPAPQAGVFAYHGRRDASPAVAIIDRLSTGVTFGLPEADPHGGFAVASSCADAVELTVHSPVLALSLHPPRSNCNAELTRPLDGGEWEIETRVDYVPRPGASAALAVMGEKGGIRLARYYLNGPAVALIHDGVSLTGDPELPGSPPLTLRLQSKGGEIRGSWSADGRHFREISRRIPASVLTGKLRAGLRFNTTALDAENLPSAARFYWYRENVTSLKPYR